MNLLIAGHGYVGRELARQATKVGHEVTALSKSGGDGARACDLSNCASVLTLADAVAPGTIIHCASSGRGGADAYRAVFLEGSRNLLATFPEARLIFVSSTSVYGQTDGSTVTEDSETLPGRETGRILLEAEEVVRQSGGTVARLAGIYGPGRSVILQKFLAGQAIIEEDGRRILNQIHRDDAASALLHLATAATSAGEVFNVADSQPLSQGDTYRGLSDLFDRPLPPPGPKPENRKRAWTHKCVSNAKLVATGWAPRHPSFLDAAREIAPTLS